MLIVSLMKNIKITGKNRALSDLQGLIRAVIWKAQALMVLLYFQE